MVKIKAKKFILNKLFIGEPKSSDFSLIEENLRDIEEGEFLGETLFLSVDPYMRVFNLSETINKTMIGGSVGRVLESRHKDFKVGDLVCGYFGWCTHFIQHGDKPAMLESKAYVLPDFGPLCSSLSLGVLGMPGNTAYFGFLELCQPKTGETVVVNAAAGAVGMHVGQIAKIKGCRVIGFAGSDDKVEWLKKEIGFDVAYNYKKIDVTDALKESAPNGVDCYFDNVGGVMSSKILAQMNEFGRISVCGAISTYNQTEPTLAPYVQGFMVFKQLRMEGFMVNRWADRWMEGIQQNLQWIKERKLKIRETITEGFENMPQAFINMLKGQNFGKAIVKV